MPPPSPQLLLPFRNTSLHIRGLPGAAHPPACSSPPQGFFLAQQTQCSQMTFQESWFLLGTPTRLCTKPGGLGSLHPSLTELELQLMWKRRRRRDKRKALYSLGGRGFTDDYPTIHRPHACSISSSPIFLSYARQLHASLRLAAGLWSKQMPCF